MFQDNFNVNTLEIKEDITNAKGKNSFIEPRIFVEEYLC